MKKQQKRTAQGFTIIEVVLVLAIAGLIFLMVFVALPGLQRSQRDTQRRNDYAMLSTSVTNYMANHNGKLPVVTSGSSTECAKNFGSEQLNSQPVEVPVTVEGAEGSGGTSTAGLLGADPDGFQYDLHCIVGGGNAEIQDLKPLERESNPKVYVVSKAKCDENGDPAKAESKRAFIVYAQLESGTYCNASS